MISTMGVSPNKYAVERALFVHRSCVRLGYGYRVIHQTLVHFYKELMRVN
jgi:hypothetical protein